MRHLETLTIHRFRGLRDLQLPDLGDVNVLVGSNNSGKTTVLEAISTHCRPLDALEWLATAARRHVNLPKALSLEALKWLFPQANGPDEEVFRGETRVTGSGSYDVRESRASYSEFLSVDTVPEEDGFLPGFGERERLGADLELNTTFVDSGTLFRNSSSQSRSNTVRLWQDERFTTHERTLEPFLPVATITPISHWTEGKQIRRLTEATLLGMKHEVLDALQMFDPDIQDLELLSKRGAIATLYIQHERVGLAPVSTFGDGIRRALVIAVTIPMVAGGVLLIDEVETSTHKTVLRSFLKWLIMICIEHQVQLIATTHSLEALDAVLGPKGENVDQVVAYRLQELGKPCKRFAGDLLHRIRYESGLDVR